MVFLFIFYYIEVLILNDQMCLSFDLKFLDFSYTL